ncbi:MAG: histidine phosphatase family protein [Erysipelotrichaceae bacterium]|nr:histidine phosphatase family protein [Erysipelotrichaceae bacterium]
MKITFYYVRHGETLFNVLGRMQGGCDSPLTEKGIEGARNTASALRKVRFAKCYSSSSERALDTADILCAPHAGLQPVPMKELKEFDFGDLDGEKQEECWNIMSEASVQDDFSSFHGEDLERFDKRSRKAFDHMVAASADGDTVLVVSHGSYMMHLMKTLLSFDQTEYITRCNQLDRSWMPNAGICIFTYENGSWKIIEEPMSADEYRQKHEPKKMTFYYVRHGETLFNVKGRLQGLCDSPLTENGIHQAENTRDKLKNTEFASAYCSTAERARDTAEIILQGRNMQAVWDKRIREIYCGKLEGEAGFNGEIKKRFLEGHYRDVGGEDREDAAKRLREFLRDAYDQAADGDTVLLVSHGGMYTVLLNSFFHIDIEQMFQKAEAEQRDPIPNGGICIFSMENGKIELIKKMALHQ